MWGKRKKKIEAIYGDRQFKIFTNLTKLSIHRFKKSQIRLQAK